MKAAGTQITSTPVVEKTWLAKTPQSGARRKSRSRTTGMQIVAPKQTKAGTTDMRRHCRSLL
eukprot:CAMPEP_0181507884 /NCGR_PEP_ID=MMETSP1110-20121109/59409_1 /TAXON_ID=174948 /ORGANISM="Symbiodinium sp., Strain CCMP421" /LENGTH=61 /DNA_ID=CAMNT_0023637125 /DNA_START=93 /DNA_END=278 /DNA_ORIENTATION=+